MNAFMDFSQAFLKMQQGNAVSSRYLDYVSGCQNRFYMRGNRLLQKIKAHEKDAVLTGSELLLNDWYVVEE